mmetsp:Transcript_6776/g.17360  ORF Transcript_6776/g.17360 Transcript_6776/m.17360 type:complete len:110 (+) Transcript_6776:1341-1670(+)
MGNAGEFNALSVSATLAKEPARVAVLDVLDARFRPRTMTTPAEEGVATTAAAAAAVAVAAAEATPRRWAAAVALGAACIAQQIEDVERLLFCKPPYFVVVTTATTLPRG